MYAGVCVCVCVVTVTCSAISVSSSSSETELVVQSLDIPLVLTTSFAFINRTVSELPSALMPIQSQLNNFIFMSLVYVMIL